PLDEAPLPAPPPGVGLLQAQEGLGDAALGPHAVGQGDAQGEGAGLGLLAVAGLGPPGLLGLHLLPPLRPAGPPRPPPSPPAASRARWASFVPRSSAWRATSASRRRASASSHCQVTRPKPPSATTTSAALRPAMSGRRLAQSRARSTAPTGRALIDSPARK